MRFDLGRRSALVWLLPAVAAAFGLVSVVIAESARSRVIWVVFTVVWIYIAAQRFLARRAE